ncbi:hypothetical protein GCM10011339_45550 [Echinicola rosea]|uniref:Uncharacterized protein n=1 Tax=Echinicola rosea TaxID=1807691 RepID=A0ABQ1VCJ4_9BACT|nr:hypothetical protein GCM10011339_45550 [Echinicola rosea]
MQILGVKKLKSGDKKAGLFDEMLAKKNVAAKKEEFACMREGFNFRPIEAHLCAVA